MSYSVRTHYLVLLGVIVCVLALYHAGAVITPDYKGDHIRRLVCQGSLALITLSLTCLYCLYVKRQPADFAFGRVLRRPTVIFAALLSTYFLIAMVIASLVLQAFPNSGDEYDYVFHGMTFSAGRLWNEPPMAAEFFKVPWMIIKDGKWTTQYEPGWPSVLALVMTAGLPAWSAGPLVGVLSLTVFIVLARHVEDDATAGIAAAACAATPFLLFNTASYFSHGLAGLFALLVVYLTVRHAETGSSKTALLAGVCLGVLGATRMYSAILIALPIVFVVCRGGWKSVVRRGVWFAMGGLPFVAALMVYNEAVTGHPLVPVKSWGFPDPALYPVVSLWTEGGIQGGIKNTLSYVFEAGEYVWPLFSIMYGGALVYKARTGTARFYDWYPLLFVVGFMAFAADAGNRYGPRYYFEAFPFAILTICSAVLALARSPRHRVAGRLAGHLLASQILVAMATVPFIAWLQHTIITERTDLFRQVATAGLENALVVVKHATGVVSPMEPGDLLRNGLATSGDVIYAVDRGQENKTLIDRFPDREIWTYEREDGARAGTLSKVYTGRD